MDPDKFNPFVCKCTLAITSDLITLYRFTEEGGQAALTVQSKYPMPGFIEGQTYTFSVEAATEQGLSHDRREGP